MRAFLLSCVLTCATYALLLIKVRRYGAHTSNLGSSVSRHYSMVATCVYEYGVVLQPQLVLAVRSLPAQVVECAIVQKYLHYLQPCRFPHSTMHGLLSAIDTPRAQAYESLTAFRFSANECASQASPRSILVSGYFAIFACCLARPRLAGVPIWRYRIPHYMSGVQFFT